MDSKFKGQVQEVVKLAENMRSGLNGTAPMEVSFTEVLKDKHNITMAEFIYDLGIDTGCDSVSNINSLDSVNDIRWIVPEIYREAIKLGMDRAPLYPNITAGKVSMKQLKMIMPYINTADAAPRRVGEGETIPLGTVAFGQKDVDVFKVGRGIKITDELKNYASIDVISIFMQDFGIKMGMALDNLALTSIINGDLASGAESAPVIGITVPGTKTYRDLLRIWIRMSRLGRIPNVIIGGEDAAMDTLDLAEFKTNASGGTAPAGVPTSSLLTMKTPVPNSSSYYIHGNVPANQEIILDPSKALLKLEAQPLKVESERIVSNQSDAFYVTQTTGFAKLFRDGSLIIDKTVDFAVAGFPAFMDVDAYENVTIDSQ